jgi:hypothetical protein
MLDSYFQKIVASEDSDCFIIRELVSEGDIHTLEAMKLVSTLSEKEHKEIIASDLTYSTQCLYKSLYEFENYEEAIEFIMNAKDRIIEGEVFSRSIDTLKTTNPLMNNTIKDILSKYESSYALKNTISPLDWFESSEIVNIYLHEDSERDTKSCYHEYLLSCLFNIFKYDNFSDYSRNQNSISKYYKNESEYKKYNLVSLNKKREYLCVLNKARIYDHTNDKTFFLQATPKALSDLLVELYKKKLITTLSFRLKDGCIKNGINKDDELIHEVQRGKTFSKINIGNEILPNMLSDKNYKNLFFISFSLNDITFEEIEEQPQNYKGTLVTQVIHLMFSSIHNVNTITHIDHEYVFYTPEQLETRKNKSSIKGDAYPRIKTFKADGCNIPLMYQCNVKWKEIDYVERKCKDVEMEIPFIQFVLESYFVHKELIKEFLEC